MKKITICLLGLSAVMFSSVAFSQDSVKSSTAKATKTTHKVVKHHKVVKKTAPAI